MSPTMASAHSVTDFLKVPVSRQATVLLPPLTLPAGPTRVVLTSPAGFTLSAVTAAAGWSSSVQAHSASLFGTVGTGPLVVTVTGLATRAGKLRLALYVSSGEQAVVVAGESDTARAIGNGARPAFTYTLTALNNYVSASEVAASNSEGSVAPDAAVEKVAGQSAPRRWGFTAALVIAAVGVLMLGGRRSARAA